MLDRLAYVIWFILPAWVANSAAIDVSGIPFLKRYSTPVDFGAKIGGKRVFGDGKTWRGLIAGVLAAVLCALLQQRLQHPSLIPMTAAIGFLLGFGALAGDLTASFLKRRIGFRRGHPVFLLDQLDYVVGAFALSALIVPFNAVNLILASFITLPSHYIANIVAWLLKLKSKPW
jgi:CDP-2,3-bis-(O-geranylgeranyl)-sn-glycerol synthase